MSKYDLAVVGSGLGGLAAAALSARMGKRTILFEAGEAVGGVLRVQEKDDFRFIPGPALSFGFDRDGTFQKLNQLLGVTQQASLRSPGYQVVFPDRRITVFAEHTELLEELGREFRREIETITRFYQDLRKQAVRSARSGMAAYIARTRRAGTLLRSYRFSPDFSAFLDVQSRYFFRQPVANLSVEAAIQLYDSAPYSLDGGFNTVANQLLDVFLKHRGEIRYRTPYSDISVGPRALLLPEGRLEADAVLLNAAQPDRTLTLLYGVREEVLPVGMLRELLYVPDYARPDRFLSLSVSARGDRSTAPEGMRTLTATFFGIQNGEKPDVLADQVRNLVPFLDDFCLFTDTFESRHGGASLPGRSACKSIWSVHQLQLLSRCSLKGVYLLPDGKGTPAQSAEAALRFIDLIR